MDRRGRGEGEGKETEEDRKREEGAKFLYLLRLHTLFICCILIGQKLIYAIYCTCVGGLLKQLCFNVVSSISLTKVVAIWHTHLSGLVQSLHHVYTSGTGSQTRVTHTDSTRGIPSSPTLGIPLGLYCRLSSCLAIALFPDHLNLGLFKISEQPVHKVM